MTDLLQLAFEAHGGLERWRQVRTLSVHAHVGDRLLVVPNQERVIRDVFIQLDPHGRQTDYGLWNGLIAPFVLTMSGIHTEEIDPREEAGEEWRRLKAVFPASVVTDAREQVYSFNGLGLLRRYDRHPNNCDVPASATYAADHRPFGGLVMATRHRVVPLDADGRARRRPVFLTIDILDVQVEYDGD